LKAIIAISICLASPLLNIGIAQFAFGPVIGYSALSITDDNMYGDSFLYTNDAYSIQSFQYGVVGKLSLRKHAILGRIMTGNIRCDVRNRGFIPIKSFKFDYYYFTVLSEYQLMNNVSLGGGFSLAVFRNLYETTSGLKVNHISDFISQKQLNLELTLNYFWNKLIA